MMRQQQQSANKGRSIISNNLGIGFSGRAILSSEMQVPFWIFPLLQVIHPIAESEELYAHVLQPTPAAKKHKTQVPLLASPLLLPQERQLLLFPPLHVKQSAEQGGASSFVLSS